jgi:bacillithiol system protein YtxJ
MSKLSKKIKYNFPMNWKPITSVDQISFLIEESNSDSNAGVLILKHSTRCSVSFFAKKNLESSWNISADKLPTYYLDLIKHRDVSNQLAEIFEVRHESPQLLLINNGDCSYSAAHSEISAEAVESQIATS